MMRSWLVAGLREPVAAALTLLMGVNAVHAADTLPPFKVTGKYMTGLALLVPRGTADTDLKALVLALRRARRENSLDKLIPPTTKGGSRGPYAIVVVHVFDEPEWATSEALERCSKTKANSPLESECGRHVRAYYFYAVTAAEEGSVGYAEGKRVFTKVYEKLF